MPTSYFTNSPLKACWRRDLKRLLDVIELLSEALIKLFDFIEISENFLWSSMGGHIISISEKSPSCKSLTAFPFTNDIHLFMKASCLKSAKIK